MTDRPAPVSTLALEQISTGVAAHRHERYEVRHDTRQAAVATILREGGAGEHTEALFILRATKDGDPWSGDMAFPGGHLDATDESLRHAAERETWEEIGIDLTECARYVGPLDQVRASPRNNMDMVVSPFLYILEAEPRYSLNHEVADVLWGSLNDMHSGEILTSREFSFRGQTQEFPGYAVGGHLVWGLTFRMLDQFFGMLDPSWEPRPS